MTNKEKFRDILENLALAQSIWTLNEKGEPVPVTRDVTYEKYLNNTERLAWLNEEYKELVTEVDWSTVAVNTPILVRDSEDAEWKPQYFARYEDGVVCAWSCGKTSWTTDVFDAWNYAKLADK